MKQDRIEIIEVGPRDGFQNVSEFIPTDIKLETIDRVVNAGLRNIQITSFVSPKAIPQMRDAEEVTRRCLEKYPDIKLFALVPNLYGARAAVECGLSELTYVISVSETHNRNNVKRTHVESFNELEKILNLFPDLKINLDVATAFGCPYEGEFSIEVVLGFLERAYNLGVRSFNLCDTVGLAYPSLIRSTVENVLAKFPDCEIQIHIHDTRNMGIVNSLAALECGIKKIQTALGGLGGCPFAPGASGNTSTEDFVYMLNKMGYKTGINSDLILSAAKHLKENVEGNYSGHHIFINKNKVSTQ
ncbi:hydroxymethylglutaryl-CoA lyase [Bacillus infantis]|uniref:hydroxymethylglutaryl-CoA lyase n=1 Tax=Bacillus infantis TaxID=324767 RepID=UPI00101D7560|nr:hydroxymethylglutaryl-CoA lyase [Bacillus infantis]RYI28752.1 hydroxymethylglutaryl-CoA lyase [Bacillus infantis]